VRAAAHTSGTEPLVSRPAGHESVGEPPTPESMVRLVVEQRHFAASGPSPEGGVQPISDTALAEGVRGKAAGPGYQTNAAIQVVDAHGRQVAFELAQYEGGSQPHAEAQAVVRLRFRLTGQDLAGGKLVVAVDQAACEGCLARLRSLATDLGLSSYEVWAPTAQEGRTAGPKWTARTAATASARPAPAPTSETPGGAAYRYEPRMIQGATLRPPPTAPPAPSAVKTTAPAATPPAAGSTTARPARPATFEPAPAKRPTAEPQTARTARTEAPEPAPVKRLA
jgi:type IV secretory pathway VirJ component